MSEAPCARCDSVTSHTVHTTGLLEMTIFVCESCWAPIHAELQEKRRQFEELLAAGVSREQANKMMIARIEGEPTQ